MKTTAIVFAFLLLPLLALAATPPASFYVVGSNVFINDAGQTFKLFPSEKGVVLSFEEEKYARLYFPMTDGQTGIRSLKLNGEDKDWRLCVQKYDAKTYLVAVFPKDAKTGLESPLGGICHFGEHTFKLNPSGAVAINSQTGKYKVFTLNTPPKSGKLTFKVSGPDGIPVGGEHTIAKGMPAAQIYDSTVTLSTGSKAVVRVYAAIGAAIQSKGPKIPVALLWFHDVPVKATAAPTKVKTVSAKTKTEAIKAFPKSITCKDGSKKNPREGYYMVVYKSKPQKMFVYYNGKLVTSPGFPVKISAGANAGQKEKEGDRKTPIGSFCLINKQTFPVNEKNKEVRRKYGPGQFVVDEWASYEICVHGTPVGTEKYWGRAASLGCVRTPNNVMSWLLTKVPNDTPITILPENVPSPK